MAKKEDGFIFHVEINAIPDIEVSDETDNLTVNPGDTLNYQFIYQGGIGDGLSTGFNIFVYDRNDTTDVVGTPDAPEAGTSTKPIPDVDAITPGTPLAGRPEITSALIAAAVDGVINTNNVYAEFTSGVWIGWHKGSFEIVTPSSGYTEPITTFLGEAQILYPDPPA